MNEGEPHLDIQKRIKAKRSLGMRIVRWVSGILLIFAIISGLGLGGLYLRLQSGPLSFPGLSERVVSTLSGYFAPGWKITLSDTALELDRGSFALRIHDLEIANGQGRVLLRAPRAIVSVSTLSLALLRIHPRMVELIDLQAIGTVNDDGSVTFVPVEKNATEPTASPPELAGNVPAKPGEGTTFGEPHGQSRLSQGMETFFNLVAGSDGTLGSLDKAQFTNLRLTLLDTKQQIRAQFNRIDASFTKNAKRGVSFEASLNGARGTWALKGDIQPIRKGYQFAFRGDDVPVQDLLFLTGQSNAPFTTTLKVSGQIDATMSKGILSSLNGKFETGQGNIDVQDKDATPLFVNSSLLDLSWDEEARQMVIRQLEFLAEGTHFNLSGDASMPAGQPWVVNLAADNAVLNGVTPQDKLVPIDRFEAKITGNGSIKLERLFVKGPDLNATIKAQYGDGNDPKAIKVDVELENTLVRSILRMWPEITASGPRRYLVSALRGGKAETGTVQVSLSGDQVKSAMNGGSIPDEALLVNVKVENGVFLPTDGLPALTKAAITATVTGRSASVVGKDAVVDLHEKRSLKVPDVTFNIADFWPDDAIGIITADAEGEAEALAAFLKLPKIREAFSWEVHPEDIRGHAKLKLGIDLPVRNVPKFADLPITVEGRLTDVTLQKAIGPEKLEKAAFAINYKNGALNLKGEGHLAGYPASITVNQPPAGKGTAVVLFSLDDAARARKGMDFNGQLTGIIPVKVTATIGKGDPESFQVDADLSKVTINNLIPGWSKPAGRAGKLTLVANTGEDDIEITDMRLEAGPVRFAGKASLDSDGGFISADLSSFQLSQGDDMQVKLDRPNDILKATIRGNLGDARPIIRSLMDGSVSGSGRNGSARSGGANLDVDANLNIITGFNNESLTKASIRAGIRNGSLRQFQLNGRLGSVNITAQTTVRGNISQLGLQADNAGSFLRFLDIYRRMYGGDMFFDMILGDGPQNGYVMLRNFTIRNEPALRQIIPSQTQGTGDRRVDVNQVSFTKARVDFVRNGSRIDFRDGAIWGTQIGFTLEGMLDFSRGRTDISGTFVPAYGLNNAFAQLPLIGPILGGGDQYGGLFGVNFRVTGPISAPNVTVNPLSAVAPGIFRRLFGAGNPGSPEPDAQGR